APSTPPPPRIAELAALTITSTSWVVMSPWTAVSVGMAPVFRPAAPLLKACRWTRPPTRPCRRTAGHVARSEIRGADRPATPDLQPGCSPALTASHDHGDLAPSRFAERVHRSLPQTTPSSGCSHRQQG